MEIEFKTDLERIRFLLEADAELRLGLLAAEGKLELVTEELPPEDRPKYITNFIGSKQKLVDWIWGNTPKDVESVFDAFSDSSVVGYMYKTMGCGAFPTTGCPTVIMPPAQLSRTTTCVSTSRMPCRK